MGWVMMSERDLNRIEVLASLDGLYCLFGTQPDRVKVGNGMAQGKT